MVLANFTFGSNSQQQQKQQLLNKYTNIITDSLPSTTIDFEPLIVESNNYANNNNNNINMDTVNKLGNNSIQQISISNNKLIFGESESKLNNYGNIENYWSNLFNNNNNQQQQQQQKQQQQLSNSTPTLNNISTSSNNELQNNDQRNNYIQQNLSRPLITNVHSINSTSNSLCNTNNNNNNNNNNNSTINNGIKSQLINSLNNTPSNTIIANNSYGSILQEFPQQQQICSIQGSDSPLSTSSSTAIIAAQQQQNQQQQQQQKNPKLYKTELCRSWVDTGRCNYGERCQYAHGDNEKRPIPRHPKYKTEACQSYHKTGYCPYGPRCHFIHSQDDPHALNSNNSNGGSNICTSTIPIPSATTGTPTTTINPLANKQQQQQISSSPKDAQIFQQQQDYHQPLNSTQSVGRITTIYNNNNNKPFNISSNLMNYNVNSFVNNEQQHQQIHFNLKSNHNFASQQSFLTILGQQQPIATSTPHFQEVQDGVNHHLVGIISGFISDDSSLQSSSAGDSGTESPLGSSSSFSPGLDIEGTTIQRTTIRQNNKINEKSLFDDFNEIQLANNLAASLSLIKKNTTEANNDDDGDEATANGIIQSIQQHQLAKNENIWMIKSSNANKVGQSEQQLHRRISGSSLGSTGNGKRIVGTNDGSFASTSVSSSEEFWPIQQHKQIVGVAIQEHQQQQQNIGRLPIFEQLSNCPF